MCYRFYFYTITWHQCPIWLRERERERERAKMAIYHYLAKYVVFYHYLRNIVQSTTLLELEFHKLKFGKLLKFLSLIKNGTWNSSFINSSFLYIKFNRLKISCLHNFIRCKPTLPDFVMSSLYLMSSTTTSFI